MIGNINPLTFVIVVLAVYRISYMLAIETGPFGICEKWRGWVVRKAMRPGVAIRDLPHYWIIEGVGCPNCISFWLSLVAFLFGWGVLGWLGVAGGVLALHKAISK